MENYFGSENFKLNNEISELVSSGYAKLQFEKLAIYFDSFAKLAPQNYLILDQSAEIHFALKNYAKAHEKIVQAKRCDKDRPAVYMIAVAMNVEHDDIDAADIELNSGLNILNLQLEKLEWQSGHIFGIRMLMLTYLRCVQQETALARKLYNFMLARFNVPKEERREVEKYLSKAGKNLQ